MASNSFYQTWLTLMCQVSCQQVYCKSKCYALITAFLAVASASCVDAITLRDGGLLVKLQPVDGQFLQSQVLCHMKEVARGHSVVISVHLSVLTELIH